MKLIGLEEHWCPKELFTKKGTPGYKYMQLLKQQLGTSDALDIAVKNLSNIGDYRIKQMDDVGLSMQFLSITAVNMELLPDDEAIEYAHLSNDILLAGIKQNPSRFRGFAAIPTDVPVKAAQELSRCMETGYFSGVIINGHIKGHYLDEDRFDPILAEAERLNCPIYLHPTLPPKSIMDTYYNVNDSYAKMTISSGGWGWHIETGTHILRMIAAGVFDRHPNLKVIVGHLGEGLPFFMDRLYKATGGKLKHSYPYYLKNNLYYTISGFHYENLFNYVLSEVPESHIMFSSDYPFQSLDEEIKFINTVPLDENVRINIAYKNAENLFGISK